MYAALAFAQLADDPLARIVRIEILRDGVELLLPLTMLRRLQEHLGSGEYAAIDPANPGQMRLTFTRSLHRRGKPSFPCSSISQRRPSISARSVSMDRHNGEILLRLDGWPKVQRGLAAIDAVESLGLDPADAAPEHWRHVHNRLTANLEPHAYTPERHAAWLHRRRIEP